VPASGTLGGSDCGACVIAACEGPRAKCREDATCKKWEACLEACPLDANGNGDAACEAACPGAERVASLALQRAFAECRAQAACGACGPSRAAPARPVNPLLTQACAGGGGESACAACEAESCCTSATECAGDPECVELGACASTCARAADPRACEAECSRAAPEASRGRHARRWACLELRCASASACGVSEPAPCDTCARARCGSEFLDCYGQPECRSAAVCANRCGKDGACVDACVAGVSVAARDAFVDYNVCGQLRCSTECGAP